VTQDSDVSALVENEETVQLIATKIIEPALQTALAKAKSEGSTQEIISALANCYGGLLVDLLGREAAATFLQAHAVHIVSREKNPLNN
jgi:hypothetical protein